MYIFFNSEKLKFSRVEGKAMQNFCFFPPPGIKKNHHPLLLFYITRPNMSEVQCKKIVTLFW